MRVKGSGQARSGTALPPLHPLSQSHRISGLSADLLRLLQWNWVLLDSQHENSPLLAESKIVCKSVSSFQASDMRSAHEGA